MTLESKIEAVLFYKAEPVKKSYLAEIFLCSDEDIANALNSLHTSLISHGIRLTTTDTHAQLVTAPEMSEVIESIRKSELKADIGKAGAETLAIILYRGPLSRAEIDKIRGVNSTFIIRNLLVRGLIERQSHKTDSRTFTYRVTPALLNHLGVTQKESLPDYAVIMDTLDAFEKDQQEIDTLTDTPFQKQSDTLP